MKIVVGVDGSAQALAAARWVVQLPLSSAHEVVVASVAAPPVFIGAWGYVHTGSSARLLDMAWKAAQHSARRAAEQAVGEFTGLPCPVHVVIREGHPIEALRRVVEELGADLLVVGPHGRGRLESILLGSVSQSLLHVMPTSILVAREPARAPERILLAVDGSPHSLAAARFLARFPLPAGARIDVLTVVAGSFDGFPEQGGVDFRDLVTFERRRAAEVIGEAVAALEAGGRTGQPAIRDGDPKREILAVAREHESDLIVMGARGVGGFRGLVLGSVSRAVSKAAPCATLVVGHHAGPSEEGGS